MAHPKMYDDGDFGLAPLRELALAFPEALEKEAHGRPTFRAGEKGKIFAYFGQGQSGRPHPSSVQILAFGSERDALLADERCYLPAYLAPAGWIGLDFAVATVDWQEIAELLDSSYQAIASARLLAKIDLAGGPATSKQS
ncbi:conserved hypothetical protein [Renibacterium salmoninarum ATCC 33209]|uniref:Phosphoribosylglycinamide formyltransferase n=1 Tax=Renibacterium salmoninarum (strain ATCC 33209 / DSM 20767 / JCM 11484 / NBRC 15589 / NCIMB 2235) TaxID=288705 RepID=A9WNK5_RENSM|nr:MmcQ/YjbR family DNA-binding protein [Renibacterium salmoninarum]ABY23223.1 conserved hypothetical protein [Renibacterium salmoninarum ATCC 33209]